jgi:hypothetical protein
MLKITPLISSILLLSILSTAACADVIISNYCKVGKCAKCLKSASGVKSCDSCIFSAKKLVDKKVTDVFSCVEKNSIKSCKIYYDQTEDSTETGCKTCQDGNFKMTTLIENLVTKGSCHENVIKETIKIPNCKTRSVAAEGFTASSKCDECKTGFVLNDSGQCVIFGASTAIANCGKMLKNGETITCSECEDGYNTNTEATACVS